MNSILIAKNVALNAGTDGTLTNANALQAGALMMVVDNHLVYTGTQSLAGKERVQFLVGLTRAVGTEGVINYQDSVPIPRRQVLSVNYEKYRASRVKIVDIGPFNWEAEGDASMVLNNNSFVRTIQTEQVRVSQYKLPNMTEESIVDKLVAAINKGSNFSQQAMLNNFCTATKTGTTPANFKIRVTMKSEHVDFSVSLQGMFAFAPVVTVQEEIISLGKGADVARTEVEYSGNLGNGGYWSYNEGYYRKPAEADPNANYDIFNIVWQGEHDTPQNRMRVARNHLMIAIPTGAASIPVLLDAFDSLFGAAFTKDEGTLLPSADEEIETDGAKETGEERPAS